MFQLYDKTRRCICIAAFLLIGVTPLLLVGGWCWNRHAPGYALAEARQLSRQLGLPITLGGVRRLRPGATLYEQLEAADPETGQIILRCRLLEVVRGTETDQQGRRRPTLWMTASQPEVDTAAMRRIWQCLQRTLEGSCGSLEADVRLSAAELTLRAADNSQTLAEVRGAVENLPGGAVAQLDFRLPGVKSSKPACIRVFRNRQVSPPASGFELDTGGGELPCSLLAIGLGQLKPLGPRCHFYGYIGGNETPQGWDAQVFGELLELDVGRLVSDHFPHRLTGTGEASILSARFHRGRLEAGSAILTVGQGKIDRSLLTAAVECLGLTPAADELPTGNLVSFDQLALLATLDARGLRLGGRCKEVEKGTILSCGGNRLLGEPTQSAPAVALARMLVPESALEVPASRQTDRLLRFLPVPDVMPVPGSESIPPYATSLRLRDGVQRQ